MTVRYALLSGVSGLLSLVFYIGVLIVVLTRRSRLSPGAARLATWSAALFLVGVVMSLLWPVALTQIANGPGGLDYTALFMLVSLATGVVHFAAIALLLMALFGAQSQGAWPGPAGMPPAAPYGGPVVLPPAASGPQAAPGGIPPWAPPTDPPTA